MGACESKEVNSKIHLRVINWKENSQGLFNYKDNINAYSITNYILTENYYIYFDTSNKEILLHKNLFKNKITQKMIKLQVENINNKMSLKVIDFQNQTDKIEVWYHVNMSQDNFQLQGKDYNPLQENETLKLGKIQIKILKILNLKQESLDHQIKEHQNSLEFRQKNNNKNFYQKSLSIQYKSLTRRVTENSFQCRICLNAQTNDQLFVENICSCAHENPIHLECLQDWLVNQSLKENVFIQQIQIKGFHCDICGDDLPEYITTKNNEQLPLFKLNLEFYQQILALEIDNPDSENGKYILLIDPSQVQRFSIGRDHKQDITLESISISREHCTLFYQENQWFIFDKYSKFGTFRRFLKNTLLSQMDFDRQFLIAKQSIQFHWFFKHCICWIKKRYCKQNPESSAKIDFEDSLEEKKEDEEVKKEIQKQIPTGLIQKFINNNLISLVILNTEVELIGSANKNERNYQKEEINQENSIQNVLLSQENQSFNLENITKQ